MALCCSCDGDGNTARRLILWTLMASGESREPLPREGANGVMGLPNVRRLIGWLRAGMYAVDPVPVPFGGASASASASAKPARRQLQKTIT